MQGVCTWSNHDPLKMGQWPALFWVMTPFFRVMETPGRVQDCPLKRQRSLSRGPKEGVFFRHFEKDCDMGMWRVAPNGWQTFSCPFATSPNTTAWKSPFEGPICTFTGKPQEENRNPFLRVQIPSSAHSQHPTRAFLYDSQSPQRL